MTIKYNANPLKTEVILDPVELLAIRYYLISERLSEVCSEVYDALEIKSAHEIKDILGNKWRYVDEDVGGEVDEYVQALKSTHFGDCIAMPTRCMKCVAEDVLGISTVEGANREMLAHIAISQAIVGDDIDVVIQDLTNKKEKYKADEKLQRWAHNCEEACVWLQEYKKKHFNHEQQ